MQVSLAHVLAVHVTGAVGVQVLDSLVLVHSLQVPETLDKKLWEFRQSPSSIRREHVGFI